jgi:hypothetical protein
LKDPANLWLRRSPRGHAGQLNPAAAALLLAVMLVPFASAQNLGGTVKNGTTGKPAGGDDVILLNLAQGMEEAARTKTDASGKFSFNAPPDGNPHLIRVIHQGVTYHKMAPPGTTSVEAEVFDVAKKIEGLTVTADVMRFETDGNDLKVVRLFAVDNNSNPPKTQMNDHNFEFYLPEGALVDQAMARTANGQPINATAVPQADKNRYAFIFPLRPGETQFQIAYHLQYSGQAQLNPKSIYPVDHFVAMLPKTMKFSGPASFQSMQDPEQTDAQVEVVSNAQPSQNLAFTISGSGVLPARTENTTSGGGGAMGGGQASPDNRPGGGLGPPIDAPDPLEKYRWYILGGFGAVLAVGAFYIAKRSPARTIPARRRTVDEDETVEIPRTSVRTSPEPASTRSPGLLLEALKEELFQLEVERQQGKISQQEYEKHKAALDQTLQRAVRRETQKV